MNNLCCIEGVFVIKYLMDCCFLFYIWLLYNWTKDKELSIFGFLDEDMEKYWLYGQIRTDVLRVKKTAPKETSVHGSKSQGFYEFDKNEFEDSKPLLV